VTAPSVGRIVHLVADDGECLAAIVTKIPHVDSDQERSQTLLTVFAPSGPTVFAAYPDEGKAVSTWHWPERV